MDRIEAVVCFCSDLQLCEKREREKERENKKRNERDELSNNGCEQHITFGREKGAGDCVIEQIQFRTSLQPHSPLQSSTHGKQEYELTLMS